MLCHLRILDERLRGGDVARQRGEDRDRLRAPARDLLAKLRIELVLRRVTLRDHTGRARALPSVGRLSAGRSERQGEQRTTAGQTLRMAESIVTNDLIISPS